MADWYTFRWPRPCCLINMSAGGSLALRLPHKNERDSTRQIRIPNLEIRSKHKGTKSQCLNGRFYDGVPNGRQAHLCSDSQSQVKLRLAPLVSSLRSLKSRICFAFRASDFEFLPYVEF
jgi:hypothetical protein